MPHGHEEIQRQLGTVNSVFHQESSGNQTQFIKFGSQHLYQQSVSPYPTECFFLFVLFFSDECVSSELNMHILISTQMYQRGTITAPKTII